MSCFVVVAKDGISFDIYVYTSNIQIMSTHNLKTLVETLNDLKRQGYKSDFFVEGTHLRSSISGNMYDAQDVNITASYRFEGESDPADSSILYVIESNTGEKGTIINAYGAKFDEQIDQYIKEVESR